jgi:hypothetical protein
MKYSQLFLVWTYLHLWEWRARFQERKLRGEIKQVMFGVEASKPDSEDTKRAVLTVIGLIIVFVALGKVAPINKGEGAPKFGEYLLYLFISERDREYLIGDLTEEYLEIRSRLGRRVANIWYYKQVSSSIWPLSKRAVQRRLVTWFGDLVRRFM